MLEVRNLKTWFRTPQGMARAVDGVSFSVGEGEILGIVGESGSGKSVSALSVMQLNPKPACIYPEGEILYNGRDILSMSDKELRNLRGNEIAMIFQDPMTSLNPVFTVGFQIMEAIQKHQNIDKRKARELAQEMLKDVGIANPEKRMDDYPHQYSGGMRQRVMIAMALSCQPRILIADEPTTALDVTVQAQILDLIIKLQQKFGMSVILITHDLGVVARIADRILVMYSGKVVEEGLPEDIFYHPAMPYTWMLLRSIPRLDDKSGRRLVSIAGQTPNITAIPKGCCFKERCPFAKNICSSEEPQLRKINGMHTAACHLQKEEREMCYRQLIKEVESNG